MKLIRTFIWETTDGKWLQESLSGFRQKLRVKLDPSPSGTIEYKGIKYVIDPQSIRRMTYRRIRFLPLYAHEIISVWKFGDPSPIPYFKTAKRDDDITGDTLSQLSRSKRLERIMNPGTDWLMIIAVLALISAIVMGIALFYSGQR